MADPLQHYRRYEDVYRQISEELNRVRTVFRNADRFSQKVMLFDSSVFAVVSVQNDISILRQAFRGYCNSDSWDELREVMKGVNYGNNKFDYIRSNFDTIFSETGDDIIFRLKTGNVWKAVEMMADELDGVSYIKAPFIPAMLGFKDVMCIDTNMAQMIPDDRVKAKDYKSVSEYREAIEIAKGEYKNLSERLSTFMFQWVCFDTNRSEGVAKHEEWFEVMLPGSSFGRQTGLSEY